MTKAGSTYYLTYDQVGSLRVVADASGNVIKRIDYDSFGNIINDTNSSFVIPFCFAGGLHDSHTGLVRFGFRDYDPDTGRWTAKDPILFYGGDTDLYGYCLSNPISLNDPYGLSDISPTGSGMGFLSAYNYTSPDYTRLHEAGKAFREAGPFANVVLDQAAQVAAQSLAYYYIHPAVGIGLTVFNTFMTLTGIEPNPCHVY
jgi:RHS repeat-associated protein